MVDSGASARSRKHWPVCLCALPAIALTAGCGADESSSTVALLGPAAATTPTGSGSVGDGELASRLEAIRGKYRLPALIGMSFGPDEIHEIGVTGVRALGHSEPATTDDDWHIGSLTKSMSATIAAMLVERGRIAWNTTIADSFPELAPSVLAQYGSIRLEELLTHTAGITQDRTAPPGWDALRSSNVDLRAQRRQLVAEYLALPPGAERGAYAYSSAGYVIAGAMLESASDASWEQLLEELLLAPLGI